VSAVLALPRFDIEVDGSPLGRVAADCLARIEVRSALSVPTQCELTFLDPPDASPSVALAPGTGIVVREGASTAALFTGEVTAVEHVYDPSMGRELRVRAYDLLHRLKKQQTARGFTDVTAEDLASELGSSVGLTVDASESGATLARVLQHRQSDFELLVEACRRSGLFLAVEGETLRLVTLAGAGDPVPLAWGSSLIEVSVELNGERSARTIRATGWDLRRIEPHDAEATSPRSGRTASAEVPPEAVGGAPERLLFDEGTPDDNAAQGLAQAELDLRAASEVVLRGVALGDAALRPGAIVEIAGVDPSIQGQYVLTEVRHSIDRELGYLSEISSAPPEPRVATRGAITTAGIVDSVDDPDGLGRVAVVLPSFGEIETGWIPVVTVAAGPNKGLVALPDPGDHVLVLLAGEDPGQAIVLGGLFGPDEPFDAGVSAGEARRYSIRTKGGHLLRFDDEATTVHLEDTTQNLVDLSPEGVKIESPKAFRVVARDPMSLRTDADLSAESATKISVAAGGDLELHAGGNLLIDAPGRTVTIRAAKIDFETA
jgi:phage protein D/phage baseplate assembly protein gpV